MLGRIVSTVLAGTSSWSFWLVCVTITSIKLALASSPSKDRAGSRGRSRGGRGRGGGEGGTSVGALEGRRGRGGGLDDFFMVVRVVSVFRGETDRGRGRGGLGVELGLEDVGDLKTKFGDLSLVEGLAGNALEGVPRLEGRSIA